MLMNNNEYLQIIETIKGQFKGAQYQAALNVNRELIMLYYHIGKVINEHKTWGSKFIENLAADIRISFPNVKGYSVRNLKYMAKFAESYPDEEFVQQAVAQIPWSHNTVILDKVKDADQRVWYIQKTTENGWSHNVLIHQIESGLYSLRPTKENAFLLINRVNCDIRFSDDIPYRHQFFLSKIVFTDSVFRVWAYDITVITITSGGRESCCNTQYKD